jgi:hypothetical protein
VKRSLLDRPWIRISGYIAVAILLFVFLDQHDVEYFQSIGGPVFGDSRTYGRFLHLWFLIAVITVPVTMYSSPRLAAIWDDYVFTSVNAMAISSGYCWLVMRAYFGSFAMRQTAVDVIPIIGIWALMFLARFPVKRIVKLNVLVLCAVIPLALQYVVIAGPHEHLKITQTQQGDGHAKQ